MIQCPFCSGTLPDESPSCPSCGAALGEIADLSSLLGQLAEEFTRATREGKCPDIQEYERRYPELAARIRELFPTLLALENAAKAHPQYSPGSEALTRDVPYSSSSHSGVYAQARFVSGTILSGRYRIVGLLGKGGMGEVYRAEDIKLGQQVALKFLPENLALDGAALARFHQEVRLARQIAHPNVCRVFDIGEEQRRHFLSMEYIDGEDLSSLLRRIGRLPKDKAVDIARQLCAGLAAAHESNVLHRDLKPANVMIDGRGKVRITDFGLAALADQVGDQVHAGTPAYMAPEQLLRREFSPKSDIYALGLVLYEVFTGHRAFHADTLADLIKLHQQASPVPPSRLIKYLDPKLEHWIMRCLEKDPRSRPTALEIAAALPGGDPLAAALAAGVTPSPEMVAASPLERALRPAAASTCMVAFLVCLFLMVLMSGKGLLHRAVPLDNRPEVLADRANALAKKLGYTEPPIDTAYGFRSNDEYLDYVVKNDPSPDRWNKLATGQPAALYFWYRQSPGYLVAYSQGKVSPDDPPLESPGMVNVCLDTTGRLIEFRAVPPKVENPGGSSNPDWNMLFVAAGLADMTRFQAVPSNWISPEMSDRREAWEGTFPEQPLVRIHIEAASYRGKPVLFKIAGPGTVVPDAKVYTPAEGRAGYQHGAQSRTFFAFSFVIFMVGSLTSALLARHNLRLGRGDRRGAFRLALYIFAAQMLAWLFQAHHVRMVGEIDLFYTAVAWALFYSGVIWLLYIALEPYVRRRWPYRIISWTRLLAGSLRDPLVGRDMLLGALFGTASTLLAAYMYLAVKVLGFPPDKPPSVALGTLRGVSGVVGQILAMQKEAISDPMFILVVLLLLSVVLRKEWLAFGAAWLLVTFGAGRLFGVQLALNWLVVGVMVAAYILVLARFGLLAAIIFQFYNFLLLNCPLTSDFFAWYGPGTILVLLVAVSLALYGYYISLAGQPVFRGGLLKD